MVDKYFLVRIYRYSNMGISTSLRTPCWIALDDIKYNTPEEADVVRNGYDDPENFIIISCKEKE